MLLLNTCDNWVSETNKKITKTIGGTMTEKRNKNKLNKKVMRWSCYWKKNIPLERTIGTESSPNSCFSIVIIICSRSTLGSLLSSLTLLTLLLVLVSLLDSAPLSLLSPSLRARFDFGCSSADPNNTYNK